MSGVLIKLGSGTSIADGLQTSVRLVGNEYLDYLAEHRDELEAALRWDLDGRDLVVSARPEALGIVKWHDHTFEIYPKFMKLLDKVTFSTLANIYFLSHRSSKVSPESIKNALDQFESDSSFFDFFFYLILNEVLSFLRRNNRAVLVSESVEVAGVRGSLKPIDSIRRFGGLRHRHVCEVQHLEPRLLFLGLIKRFALGVFEFARVEKVRSLALTVSSLLSAVEPVELNRENIRQLKNMSPLLISEARSARFIIENIVSLYEASKNTEGVFGHASFMLNLNYHYEDLVVRVLKIYAEYKEWTLGSGNERPLDLLDNVLVGIAATEGETEGDEDAPLRSITIKPDMFIEDRDRIRVIADAKYKVLEANGTQSFTGVSSKDIQQMLSYWLHFLNRSGGKHPDICLIYPEVDPAQSAVLIRQVGSVVMRDPSGVADKLRIKILMINLETSIPLLLDEATERASLCRRIGEEIDAALTLVQRSQ